MYHCIICSHADIFAYVQMPVTKKYICVPCSGIIKDLYDKYILDIAHKGRQNSHVVPHRKIQDPDGPSGSML